jgi:hypothetical protein
MSAQQRRSGLRPFGWWRKTGSLGKRFVRVEWDEEPPTGGTQPSDRLVLGGSAPYAKWLSFACPCGCGVVVSLNLMKRHRPCWRVTLHSDGTLSAFPSVDVVACSSHFFLDRNRVYWV